jgi:hypothetical protein
MLDWHAVVKLAHPWQWETSEARQQAETIARSATKPAPVPNEFVAHTYSSSTLTTHVTQASLEIGVVARLEATLREYEVP